MSQSILFNGLTYTIPDTGEEDWGTNLTTYFVALPQGCLQKTGGTFTLTADVNFGATYGPVAIYVKSFSNNIAASGFVRMARTDGVTWRNVANNADLTLTVNGSNLLTFNGTAIQPAGSYITNLTGDVTADGPGSVAATVNAVGGQTASAVASGAVAANAATNANTASTIVKRDGSGNFSAGTITATLSGNATNVSGTVAISNGGTGQTTKQPAFDALSPLTTKGDVLGFSTVGVRVGVGSDGQVLTADSASTPGFKWAAVPSSPTSSYEILNLGLATSVGSNLLTVSLKQADGSSNPSSGAGAVNIGFRSSTATSGLYNIRSVTSSLSVSTVTTTATFGLVNGGIQYLYVYAIDNAGTVELALSGSQVWDEASTYSTSAINGFSTNLYGLYSTSARGSVPIRLIGRLAIGNATAGIFLTGPTELSIPSFVKPNIVSSIRLWGSNGGSATNTTILYYSNFSLSNSNASDITYSGDPTLGDQFTINRTGIYTGGINNYNTSGAGAQGMSVNSNQLTTSIQSISAANILTETASPASGTPGFACWTTLLKAGDIVRPHCNTGAANANTDPTQFCYITRLS